LHAARQPADAGVPARHSQADNDAGAHPQAESMTTDVSGSSGKAPVLLQVRPRRITIYASIAAALEVGSMVVIGILLRNSNEGVVFRFADQIGLIGVGIVLGGVIMTAARPRLRVDRNGLWIRNVLGEAFTPWQLVIRVAYPQGAPWAQLMMPDDEVKAIMAIQALDRGRAVRALQEVRELQAKYGPPQPIPPAPKTPAQDPPRPLGRLEIIDQQKAAARDRDRMAKQQKQADRGGSPPVA
jgi:Bacterial PH domain